MNEKKDTEIIFEQYKLYVESIENVRNKRFRIMQYYSSILLGLIGVISIVSAIKANLPPYFLNIYLAMIGLIGVVLCLIWTAHINAYKQVNLRKLKVLYEIEKQLPVSPFIQESEKTKEESRKPDYWGVIKSEETIVLTFSVLFFVIYVLSLISLP